VYKLPEVAAGAPSTRAALLYSLAVFAAFSGPGNEEDAIRVLDWLCFAEGRGDDLVAASIANIVAYCTGLGDGNRTIERGDHKPVRYGMSLTVEAAETITVPNSPTMDDMDEVLGKLSIRGFLYDGKVRRSCIGVNAQLFATLLMVDNNLSGDGIPRDLSKMQESMCNVTFNISLDVVHQYRNDLLKRQQTGNSYSTEWTHWAIETCAGSHKAYSVRDAIQNVESAHHTVRNPIGPNKKRLSAPHNTDNRADVPYDDFWADVRSGVHRIEHYVGIATMTDSRHYKTVNEPLAVLARDGVLIPANGAACAKYVGDLPKITIAVASHKGGGPSGAYSGSRTVRTDRTSASGGGGVDSDSDNSDYHGLARATQQTATTIEDDDAGGDGQHQDRRSVLQDKPGQTTSYSATHNDAHETFVDETETGDAGQVDLY
jgi:hypothetical protein